MMADLHVDYFSNPGISATALKYGAKSMKHMHAYMTGGLKRDSDAMTWGRLVHAAILEPDALFRRLSVWDGRKTGKEWDNFAACHDTDWTVKRDQEAALLRIVGEVNGYGDARQLLEGCKNEVSLYWQDGRYGEAKARLDAVKPGVVVEVKSTSKIETAAFGKQVASLGYVLQCGWYQMAAEAAIGGGAWAVYIVAVESAVPFDVAVYQVPAAALARGREEAVRLAERYRACEAAGKWPGVQENGMAQLPLPTWFMDAGEVDLSTGEGDANEL